MDTPPNSQLALTQSEAVLDAVEGPHSPGSGSERLWREDMAHFVHPFTHFDSFKKRGSLILTEAKGAYIFDSNGKRYLDGIGGLWCMSIGFGEEEMVAAIAEQVRRLSFYSAFVNMTNAPAVDLAAELARLKKAVAELAAGVQVDEQRLALEIALMADRVDITEELVRLRTHLAACGEALASDGAVGKQLGFLAQELLREVNTIGSKANDAGITQTVITMKGELEKFREQLDNLE